MHMTSRANADYCVRSPATRKRRSHGTMTPTELVVEVLSPLPRPRGSAEFVSALSSLMVTAFWLWNLM